MNGLFEELGRHAGEDGPQECLNCGLHNESIEHLLFECATWNSKKQILELLETSASCLKLTCTTVSVMRWYFAHGREERKFCRYTANDQLIRCCTCITESSQAPPSNMSSNWVSGLRVNIFIYKAIVELKRVLYFYNKWTNTVHVIMQSLTLYMLGWIMQLP